MSGTRGRWRKAGRILEIPGSLPIESTERDAVLAATRRWLERAVVGLGLCPFAAPVIRSGRLRLEVCEARAPGEVLEALCRELLLLAELAPAECETTLLVHPWALTDFAEFNEFLADCDAAVAGLGLEGTLQVASFHPQYQFAGTRPDDVGNCTNRSPYPTLHLLREDSIAEAVDAGADADAICDANVRALQLLGPGGWARLWRD
jgi:hypothetical protein